MLLFNSNQDIIEFIFHKVFNLMTDMRFITNELKWYWSFRIRSKQGISELMNEYYEIKLPPCIMIAYKS